MICSDSFGEIKSIQAYPFDAIQLPFTYTFSLCVPRSSVIISGDPEELDVAENSAMATCLDENSASGKVFQNSLTWNTEDVSVDVMNQIEKLISQKYHFIYHTYDGKTKLIYNWNKAGSVTHNSQNGDSGEVMSVSYNGNSLVPILTLTD